MRAIDTSFKDIKVEGFFTDLQYMASFQIAFKSMKINQNHILKEDFLCTASSAAMRFHCVKGCWDLNPEAKS
jgi:hypothetical protein